MAAPAPNPAGNADALPTQSILSPYELSLGAICGICAGVFIKKGAKLIAFFLGGVYVLMQVSPTLEYFATEYKHLTTVTRYSICNPAHLSTSTGASFRRLTRTRSDPFRLPARPLHLERPSEGCQLLPVRPTGLLIS